MGCYATIAPARAAWKAIQRSRYLQVCANTSSSVRSARRDRIGEPGGCRFHQGARLQRATQQRVKRARMRARARRLCLAQGRGR
jgi:hypothetical protein